MVDSWKSPHTKGLMKSSLVSVYIRYLLDIYYIFGIIMNLARKYMCSSSDLSQISGVIA